MHEIGEGDAPQGVQERCAWAGVAFPIGGSGLTRRSALAGFAVLALGGSVVKGTDDSQPVLVDGWLIRLSDVKTTTRAPAEP